MRLQREDFVRVLTAVQPGLASREVLEQTQSFIFVDKMVVTYNDEVSVRYPFDGGFTGAVKAEELFKLLRRTKSTTIDVEVTDKELSVRTKSSKAGIALEPDIIAPINEMKCPALDDPEAWHDLPANFKEALKFCHPCIGQNMSRPLLTCIHFNTTRAEATDSFRISVYKLTGEPLKQKFLVPGTAVKDISGYVMKEYCVANGWLHLKTADNAIFSCRTYTDEYPSVEKALHVEGREFKFPDGMDAVVERAVVFIEAEEFATDKKIEIAVQPGKMLIHSQGRNGWFKEVLSSDYDGTPFMFYISPSFLLAAYEVARSCIIGDGRLSMSCDQFTHVLALVKVEKKAKKEKTVVAEEESGE